MIRWTQDTYDENIRIQTKRHGYSIIMCQYYSIKDFYPEEHPYSALFGIIGGLHVWIY